MVAEVSVFQPMFLLLFFNTSTAQGKGELVTSTDGEYRVIKPLRIKDVHQSHTKVMMDILITWASVNERKPYREFFVLVEPGVKTRDIGILYLFTLPCFGIQRGRTRLATKECISGVQQLHHVQRLQKFLSWLVGFLIFSKLTLPFFNDGVTSLSKHLQFSLCGFIHFLYCPVQVAISSEISFLKTGRALVIITALKFKHRCGF